MQNALNYSGTRFLSTENKIYSIIQWILSWYISTYLVSVCQCIWMHNNLHLFFNMTLGMSDLLKVFTSSYQHPHNYSLVLIPILFPNSQFPPFIFVILTISSCSPLPLLSQFQSSCPRFPPFVSLIPGPWIFSQFLTTFSQFLLVFFQLPSLCSTFPFSFFPISLFSFLGSI